MAQSLRVLLIAEEAAGVHTIRMLAGSPHEVVAVMTRGVDPVQTMTLFRGDWHSGYDPAKHNVGIQCTPLTTQLLHAVGVAHAAKLRGEDTVVLAMCGDGATSEGDFHEALNFAAVLSLPVVFVCENNLYMEYTPIGSVTAVQHPAADRASMSR